MIDALIVELSLDAKKFTDGQKQAIESLRQTERQATQSTGRIAQSGSGLVAFFRGVEHPVAALRHHFETLATSTIRPRQGLADLAAQGRRTGAGVEAGALAGAAGLRALGIAGAVAFVTITALDKTMKAAGESAKNVFSTSVLAGAAGMGIQRTSAISQALLKGGNVPEAETQGWLAEMRQWQQHLRLTGQGAERLTPLTQVGAGIAGMTDTPEQMLVKMARSFAGLTTDEAIARGALANLSAAASLELRRQGADLPASVAAARQTAVTRLDSEAARNLTDAQNRLSTAWDKLTRTVYDYLDPAFAKLTDWITWLIGGQDRLLNGDALERARGAGTFTGPETIWAWFRGQGKTSLWERLMADPFGKPSTGGSVPTRSGATGPQSSSSNLLDVIAQDSGNRNIMNAQGSSAAGWFQILQSNWEKIGQGIFGFTAPNAMAASPYEQAKVAQYLNDHGGLAHWGKGQSWPHLSVFDRTPDAKISDADVAAFVASHTGTSAGSSNAGLSRYYRDHGGFLGDPGWHAAAGLPAINLPARGSIDALRAAQRAGTPGTAWGQTSPRDVTHDYSDLHWSGNIIVNAPSGNPYVIGGAAANAIKNMVTGANSGQS